MDASFDYYKAFYYVAKYSNFTRAAGAMLSSQPAVTRSIQNLESELGCRLFIRSRHGVTLTPEGKLLYRYVAPACERILRGEEELGAGGPWPARRLRQHRRDGNSAPLPSSRPAFRFPAGTPGRKDPHQQRHHSPGAFRYERRAYRPCRGPYHPLSDRKALYLCPVCVRSGASLVGGSRFAHLCSTPLSLSDLKQYPLAGLSGSTMSYRFYEDFLPHRSVSAL